MTTSPPVPDDLSTDDGARGASAAGSLHDGLMELARGVAPLVEGVARLGAWCAEHGDEIRTFAAHMIALHKVVTTWEKDAPEPLKQAIRDAGLIVPSSQMSFPDVASLIETSVHGGASAAVERLEVIYEEIFVGPEFLARLEETWKGDSRLARRVHLLSHALEAHRRGLFGASVPALMAQFEGLVADLSGHHGRLSHAKVKEYVNELGGDFVLLGPIFSSFLLSFFDVFEHRGPIPPFSRHAILHGGDTNYATEIRSRTAILLIEEFRALSLHENMADSSRRARNTTST